jgi:hypothetical protein
MISTTVVLLCDIVLTWHGFSVKTEHVCVVHIETVYVW